MPLTESYFHCNVQSASTVQIQKLFRWRFKMETSTTVKVGANFLVRIFFPQNWLGSRLDNLSLSQLQVEKSSFVAIFLR